VHAEERHQALLRWLRAKGSIRVAEVAEELGVSAITIRRDVEHLASKGLLTRVHGGAMLPANLEPVPAGEDAMVSTRSLLSSREPLTLGMVVPSATYYYPEVIKGAREATSALGARLVLGISHYSAEEEARQIRQMLDSGVDALLFTPNNPQRNPRELDELPVPVVLVERRAPEDSATAEHVVTDHQYGARLAVRHLAGLGAKRIGLVLRRSSPTSPWLTRGYAEAMRQAGLDAAPEAAFTSPGPSAFEQKEYDRYLERFCEAVAEGRVQAALVHNDHEAMALLQQLRIRSLSVPDDVAIVAYDDEVAGLAGVPLTAVAPPKHAVGAIAVDLAARRISSPGRPRHRLALLPELRVRSSCGALARATAP
jgi:DNA-binding LacI/PurR family transcriptional regulator